MLKEILKNIKTPSMQMHGAPFWAWNGKLEPEILKEQIHTFKEMGFGGFYMHSRTGLATEYLSEEWFRNIDFCISEAEKIGLLAYLYDEDRWPSGAAGGIVTADDCFRAIRLCCSTDQKVENGKLLAAFAITFDNDRIASMRYFKNVPEQFESDEKIFYFFQITASPSSWYNNGTYLNTLDANAVKRFIEITHEKYADRYGSKFSKSIPAIFTDEPCYGRSSQGLLPWTEKLPDEFQKRFGYDILQVLPELFFEVRGDVSRTKHDFYDLLTHLFNESFFGEISKWCEKHNLPLCGHLLSEDQLTFQLASIGCAMRSYEKMQIPGVDVLTERWNVFNTVKQCVSVAHQLGKKQRLSETYGCTGWDFPLFGHIALGDWQYALGINRRCLHLSWYSMQGEAKRDYPASFLYHSPWYKKYNIIEDHFARLSAALDNDNEIRDLLIIHPIESAWSVAAVHSPEKNRSVPLLKKLDQENIDLTNLLLAKNIDFDFGDEEMMSRLASVSGKEIKIGQASYRQILIPELLTIRSTTLDLLSKFNGKVFYIGEIPQFADAMPSGRIKEIYKKFIPAAMSDIADKIGDDFRRVSICHAPGVQAEAILYRLADCSDGYSLFVSNTSMQFSSEHMDGPQIRNRIIKYPAVEITLDVPFRGNVAEIDISNGNITPVKYLYENGKYKFSTAFEQLQSRLFLIGSEFGDFEHSAAADELKNITLPNTEYAYKLSEENLLVLDHAVWETDGKQQKSAQFILLADMELRKLIGEDPRSGTMLQPWYRNKQKQNTIQKSIPLKLTYSFECEDVPQSDCILTIENPDKFTICLNGSEIQQKPCGFYLDRALINLKLDRKLFQKGENEITIFCPEYDNQTDLEALFIRGDFGVKNGKITKLPQKITPYDWTTQGLENYAGNVTYFAELDNEQPCKIGFPDWRGTLLGIKINDSGEKILLMPPFKTELPQGKCKLEITVYGHRRNAFGPFFTDKWPMLSSSGTFKKYDTPIRQLVPCGLKI